MVPPPRTTNSVSIIDRIKQAFRLWLLIVPHVPKIHRGTIIARISNIFLDIIETSYHAYYTSGSEKLEKIIYINKKLDSMKFLMAITWENKLIQNKQYEEIAKELNEIGQMLFGWKRSTESSINKIKTPTNKL